MSKEIHICTSNQTDAFQDYYPDDYSHCFGCGRLNEQGLQIKSYWDKDESICRFLPKNHFTGGRKDILYGGLIASLMDCHGAGTAAAAMLREQGIEFQKGEMPKFVTACMKVDYLAPTPVDTEIELRGRVKELKGRKVIVEVSLLAEQKLCARGELIFVQLKE